MEKLRLGEQEFEVLRFVTERGPLAVADAARHFAETRGLARTTVLTVMERLRKKGYLVRTGGKRSYRYEARSGEDALLQDAVQGFVQRTLGGSVTPFVAYLVQRQDLTADEIRALRALVDGAAPEKAERGPGVEDESP